MSLSAYADCPVEMGGSSYGKVLVLFDIPDKMADA
ncbi:Hypothetical protein OINT_2001719 [Brucella intermedia LMG 3301]|uniref:Uncharacterized protein n=1 Tax=Brucella intermedia LMG 3301 TaxID=641118 RepID=C4WQE9_9HYPH|nr:Hypothetical protein OINT_2001719 [Brucella intermedia LMG 3301]